MILFIVPNTGYCVTNLMKLTQNTLKQKNFNNFTATKLHRKFVRAKDQTLKNIKILFTLHSISLE